MIKCYNCFKDYDDANAECPYCGHIPGSVKREVNHLPLGSILIDRYLIGEVCGFGGFGVTYKAWDMQLEAIVAVKEYFPNGAVNRVPGTEDVVLFSGNRLKEFHFGLVRFIEEAKITAKYVSHKNIVNVYNYFETNKTAYIVMEYLDGITLENYLQQFEDDGERIDIDTAVDITLNVCNALKAIHADNVIHRDVSPDNIFICFNGTYKLYDFGASRFSQNEDQHLTIILKPGYAPPEQYEKVNTQGPWTDIYALGATLYKMLTGVKPVESMNRKIVDELQEPKELVPDIPQYLNDAVMKAMAVEQHLRFQKVEEFEAVLKKERPVEAVKTTIKRKKRRRISGICAAAAIVLTGSGILAYNLLQQKEENTLPAASIDVWYIADSDELTGALEDIKDEFCSSYEGVSVNYIAIEPDEYDERLSEAAQAGNMPALLQSDLIDTAKYSFLSLEPVMEEIDLDNYYILGDQQAQILADNKLPLGFNIPLFYMNTTLSGYSGDPVSELKEIASDDSMIAVAPQTETVFQKLFGGYTYQSATCEQFLAGEAAFLFSDTAQFYDVQEALPARFKMVKLGIDEVPCTLCNCWSLGDCGDEKKEKVARRFLAYMLSDNSQDYLFIRYKEPGLPVNRNALGVYEDVYLEFESVISPSEQYVFEQK